MEPLVRTLVDADIAAVVNMNEFVFRMSGTKKTILKFCSTSNCLGLVVEAENQVIAGFLLLEAKERKIVVHRLCVHPDFERRGYAKALILAASDQMNDRQHLLVVDVCEINMQACLLLKSLGMKSQLIRGLYHPLDGVRFYFNNKADDQLTKDQAPNSPSD